MAQTENKAVAAEPISMEEAMRICEQVQAENRHHWLSAAHWQCWGCVFFTTGVPEKMCFSSVESNRGCALVNRRLEHHEN